LSTSDPEVVDEKTKDYVFFKRTN